MDPIYTATVSLIRNRPGYLLIEWDAGWCDTAGTDAVIVPRDAFPDSRTGPVPRGYELSASGFDALARTYTRVTPEMSYGLDIP